LYNPLIVARLREIGDYDASVLFFRMFIVLLVLISIMWVPIIQHFQGGQLFFYIQEVTNYISPPIAAIFLIGVLWSGCTEKVIHQLLRHYCLWVGIMKYLMKVLLIPQL